MTVQELYLALLKELKKFLTASVELEANWIIEHFCNIDFISRIKQPTTVVAEIVAQRAFNAASERQTGKPLAYILGYKDFYSLKFKVNESVLIPRPETELLVEWAIEWLQDHTIEREEIQILELGTGSGCIPISIARATIDHFKNTKITAIEKSRGALEVANENRIALAPKARIEMICADAVEFMAMAAKSDVRFDLILANPPYIDPDDIQIEAHVKKFEPNEALFAKGGTSTIVKWLEASHPLLKKNAAIGFEIGADQGEKVLQVVRDLGAFSQQYIVKDLAGHDRFVCAER